MVRIAVAQLDPVLGDFSGNVERILAAAQAAQAQAARVLLTPELALCGCPPQDYLLRADFLQASARALDELAARAAALVPGLTLIVGHPETVAGGLCNAASLVAGGQATVVARKTALTTHAGYDERHYFQPGAALPPVAIDGLRCAVSVGEPAEAADCDLQLLLAATPFQADLLPTAPAAAPPRQARIVCNLVGCQDEWAFAGASTANDAAGRVAMRLPEFAEALGVVEIEVKRERGADGVQLSSEQQTAPLSADAALYRALVAGVAGYVKKNRFPGVLIGLSGGMDSALVLCIAVDALGAERVQTVMMPSPYTAQMSLDDARAMARHFGCRYDEIPIAPAMQTFKDMLDPLLAGLPPGLTEENLQSRFRANILMALSNQSGKLVLTTGNKSETAVGYCTLYGDTAGGFATLKDVYKTRVYRLGHYRNSLPGGPAIPQNILTRAPSAELSPGQTDQDSLPDYAVLDAIAHAYIEEGRTAREIIASGQPEAAVRRVVQLLRGSEYKRRQGPPGLRLSARSFGSDWHYPVTQRYVEDF